MGCNEIPHRTTLDPKILGDGTDETPWLNPNRNFWGSGAVFLGDLGSPIGCTVGVRAELLARTPSAIVYLGHLYAGESGQFCPQYFWVRCGPVRYFVGPNYGTVSEIDPWSPSLDWHPDAVPPFASRGYATASSLFSADCDRVFHVCVSLFSRLITIVFYRKTQSLWFSRTWPEQVQRTGRQTSLYMEQMKTYPIILITRKPS